jgi:hypothetical protein
MERLYQGYLSPSSARVAQDRYRIGSLHCKKMLAIFPSPAGMSLTKLSQAGNYFIIPGQGEFG